MAKNKSLLIFAKQQVAQADKASTAHSTEQKVNGACAEFGLNFGADYSLRQIQIPEPKPSSLAFEFVLNSEQNSQTKAQPNADLLQNLVEKLKQLELDVFVFEQDKKPMALKLALFDMDSTLIQAEVMDELARFYGVYDKVSQITEIAMRGEIDFNESFSKRLAMLKDMPTSDLENIRAKIQFTPNAEILFEHLHKQGVETVLVSGGFDYFASYFAEKLGIKEFHANVLQAKNNKLTGEPVLPILDSSFKSRLLQQKQADLGVSAIQVLAVGDGANDIPMLAQAGFGVAYKAKPLVQEKANFNLKFNDLDSLAYLLYLN